MQRPSGPTLCFPQCLLQPTSLCSVQPHIGQRFILPSFSMQYYTQSCYLMLQHVHHAAGNHCDKFHRRQLFCSGYNSVKPKTVYPLTPDGDLFVLPLLAMEEPQAVLNCHVGILLADVIYYISGLDRHVEDSQGGKRDGRIRFGGRRVFGHQDHIGRRLYKSSQIKAIYKELFVPPKVNP